MAGDQNEYKIDASQAVQSLAQLTKGFSLTNKGLSDLIATSSRFTAQGELVAATLQSISDKGVKTKINIVPNIDVDEAGKAIGVIGLKAASISFSRPIKSLDELSRDTQTTLSNVLRLGKAAAQVDFNRPTKPQAGIGLTGEQLVFGDPKALKEINDLLQQTYSLGREAGLSTQKLVAVIGQGEGPTRALIADNTQLGVTYELLLTKAKAFGIETSRFKAGQLEGLLGATPELIAAGSAAEVTKLNSEVTKLIELSSRAGVTTHDIAFGFANADDATVKLIGVQRQLAEQFVKARTAAGELGQEFIKSEQQSAQAALDAGNKVALAVEKARLAKLEEIVTIKQSVNARREDAAAALESTLQAQRFRGTLERPIPAGVRADPQFARQISNVERELGTLDTAASKYTLIADDINKVIQALNTHNTALLEGRQDLNALYTAGRTYIASYDILIGKVNAAKAAEEALKAAVIERAAISKQLLSAPQLTEAADPRVSTNIRRSLDVGKAAVLQAINEVEIKAEEFSSLFTEAFVGAGTGPSLLAQQFPQVYNALVSLANKTDAAAKSFTKSFEGIAAPIQKEILALVTEAKIDLASLHQILEGTFDATGATTQIQQIIAKVNELNGVVQKDAQVFQQASQQIEQAYTKEIIASDRAAQRVITNAAEKKRKVNESIAAQKLENEEIAKSFGSVVSQFDKPKFIGTKEQVAEVREAFVALTIQAKRSGLAVTDIKTRLQELLTARAALARGDILTLPPVGAVTEADNQAILRVHDSLVAVGEAGSKAAQRITISFQGLLRLLQVQVLHTLLFQLFSEFQQAITASGEFEQKVALARTIVEGAKESFDQWADSIRKVSNTLGLPSVDLATAAYDSLSNQITNTTADTSRFLEIAGNLARVTGSTVPDTVNLLSASIRGFNLSNSDAERIAAGFFSTIDKGRVKIVDLGNTYGRTSNFGKALSISNNEINAGLVVLTQAGIRSGEVQTQLNAIFSKLLKPTKEFADVLKEAGYASGQELIQAKGLGGAIQFIAQAARDGKVEITDVFNEIRGSKGFFGLAENSAKAFAQALLDVTPNVEKFRAAIDEFNKPAGVRLQQDLLRLRNFITDDLGRDAIREIVKFSDLTSKALDSVTEFFNFSGKSKIDKDISGLNNLFQKTTSVIGFATKALLIFGQAAVASFVITKLGVAVTVLNTALQVSIGTARIATSGLVGLRAAAILTETSINGLTAATEAFIVRNKLLIVALIGYVAVDQALKNAASGINELNDAFDKNKEAAIKDSEEIAKTISENNAKNTESVRKALDEQIKLYTNQTVEIRKALEEQATAQKSITDEISGQLAGATKLASEQISKNINTTKKAAEGAAKDIETLTKFGINQTQEHEKKAFETKVRNQPRNIVPLTLARATQLQDQAAEFLKQGNQPEALQRFKEAEALIESLGIKLDKATLKTKEFQAQLQKNVQIDTLRQVLPDANQRKLEIATRALQEKQFIPADEATVSKKSLDARAKNIAEIGKLLENENRKQFNRQVTNAAKIQAINDKLTKANAGLDSSYRPDVEKAQNNLIEHRNELLAETHKQLLENQIADEKSVVVQELLANEAERYKKEFDKIKLTTDSGEALSPEKIEKAKALALDLRDKYLKALEDIQKAQAKVFSGDKPLIDPKLLEESKRRIATLFDAKIDSLFLEAAIQNKVRNVEKLKEAVVEAAKVGKEKLNELGKDFEKLAEKIDKAALSASAITESLERAVKNELIGPATRSFRLPIIGTPVVYPNINPQLTAGDDKAIKAFEALAKIKKQYGELTSNQLKIDNAQKEVASDPKDQEAALKLNKLLRERQDLLKESGGVIGVDQLRTATDAALNRMNEVRDDTARFLKASGDKFTDPDKIGKIPLPSGGTVRSNLESQKAGLSGIDPNQEELNKIKSQMLTLTLALEAPRLGFENLQKAINGISLEHTTQEMRDFVQAVRNLDTAFAQRNKELGTGPNRPSALTSPLPQLETSAASLKGAFERLMSVVNTLSDTMGKINPSSEAAKTSGEVKSNRYGGPVYRAYGGLIPSMISPGEIVVPPDIARTNMPLLNKLNYFANGGPVNFRSRGTDTIPAMLEPGSYVLNARASQNFIPILRANQTSVRSNTAQTTTANNVTHNNTFGDINLNMQGNSPSVRQFANDLKRAVRQGRIKP